MSSNLVKAWCKQRWAKRPYILAEDEKVLYGKTKPLTSFAEYIADCDFPKHHRSHFHTGLIPVPFHGNVKQADIFLCLINPGLNVLDYYAEDQQAYRKLLFRNLKQEFAGDPYPFFLLDPKWSWTSGGKWWSDLFGNIITELRKHKPKASYADVVKIISRRVASLELIPYHSFDSGHSGKLVKDLRSSFLMIEFVRKKILVKARSGKALLVIASGANKWDIEEGHPNVVYQPKNHRKAHLSMKQGGAGSRILERLLN